MSPVIIKATTTASDGTGGDIGVCAKIHYLFCVLIYSIYSFVHSNYFGFVATPGV
jgi:hypothetical protein